MKKNSELIILFDSVSDFEDLKKIISKKKPKIISINYETHKILKDKKIDHEISDNYLTKNDLRNIQNTAFSVSAWFDTDMTKKNLSYSGVNLGSLIQDELINILVNYMRKFFALYKISKHYDYSIFTGSYTCSKIMEYFSKETNRFKNSNTENIQIPLDSLKVRMKLGTKKHSMEFKISKNIYKKLKSISEKSSRSLLSKNRSIKQTSKNILIIEFDHIRYESFFEQMPNSHLNFLMYNRRRPTIWNYQSYNLIKQSGCFVETESSLLDTSVKEMISNGQLQAEEVFLQLFSKESFFESFFSFDGISFWPTFKVFFQEYFRKRAFNFIKEIELTKRLMEKTTISSILILSEVGPNERIASQLANQKNIPVCLVQHGVNFNTKEGYDMSVCKGVLPIKSDHFLCWGKITEEYAKNLGIKSEKIHSIGSPLFDKVKPNEQNYYENDYVLLATDGPTKEEAPDLTVKIIEKNIDAIKKVCQLVTKYNKKLIIKIHPSLEELDPSFISKQVNSKIKIIKEGKISPLIQSCECLIVIDFQSTILDAHMLEKPVISLSVKEQDYGIPTALKNNSCLVTNLETLDTDLKSVLNNKSVRKQLIINGEKSCKEYLSNQNNGSKELIRFLEELVN